MGGDKEPASKAVSSGKSQPFSGSVSSTRLLGGRQGRAGRRVVGGKQSPPASPSGDVPGLAAGRVCPSHCGRAGTHPPPCSKAGPVVGGQGCQEGPGHSPDFKAFPRGLVVPSALSRAAAAGVADAVSSAGASGRPPEGPPGRFRGAVGVSAAAAQPERAHSGLPGPSVPQAWGPGVALWNRDWCSLPSLPSLPPPPLPTKLLGSGPLPSLAASAEPPGEGRGGGAAGSEQRVPVQPSICASCQRQTGMWGIWCVWGWGKQPGGQAGRRREGGAVSPAC